MGDKTWIHWKEYSTVDGAFTGKLTEVPKGPLFAWVLAGSAVAVVGMRVFGGRWPWDYNAYGTNLYPEEWQIENAKYKGIAQRVNGPPVFLNPFRHRIPGNVLGPEDLVDDK